MICYLCRFESTNSCNGGADSYYYYCSIVVERIFVVYSCVAFNEMIINDQALHQEPSTQQSPIVNEIFYPSFSPFCSVIPNFQQIVMIIAPLTRFLVFDSASKLLENLWDELKTWLR